MDGEGSLNALLVVGAPRDLERKFAGFGPIELGERSGRHVAMLEHVALHRLEQPPANDLEAFLGGCRPPRGFETPDNVAEPVERLAAADAADLDVIAATA